MATTVVMIAFIPVLEKICSSLGFKKPIYERAHALKEIAYVVVETYKSPIAYKFVGDESHTSFHDSCESAAQQMCIFLVRRYRILVHDVNLDLRVESEKCTQLFQLQRDMLERGAQLMKPANGYGLHPIKGVDYGDNKVRVEFLEVLKTVVRKLGISVSPIEVLPLLDDLYISWFTVSVTGHAFDTLPVVGDYCPCIYTAKESMARKALELLMKVYNFDIGDVNYFFLADATISYSAEQMHYFDLKEQLLGVKINKNPCGIVVDGEPVNPATIELHRLLAKNAPLPLTFAEQGQGSRSFSDIRPAIAPPPLSLLVKSKSEADQS